MRILFFTIIGRNIMKKIVILFIKSLFSDFSRFPSLDSLEKIDSAEISVGSEKMYGHVASFYHSDYPLPYQTKPHQNQIQGFPPKKKKHKPH